jgi:HK97 family phage prohead protease
MPKNREMIYKTFDAFILDTKQISEDEGVVKAIVNTFGIIDQAMPPDVVHPGSFTKTIQERTGKIRVLDNHQTDSVTRAIGRPVMLREVGRDELPAELLSKNPTATGGLYTETLFMLDDPTSAAVFKRLKAGFLNEFSIGFQVIRSDFQKMTHPDTGKEITVRQVREASLWEYSVVLWGASETATVGVKSVVPKQDIPLADRNRAWDSAAADARVRAWAGGEENLSWTQYRKAFMWYDGDNPQEFGSFKLGYADVIDGELKAIPRGIMAIAGVLQGARGGVSIPDADKTRIKGIVSRWYAQMRTEFDDDTIVPPWDESGLEIPMQEEKEITADGQEVQRLGDFLFGCMFGELMSWVTFMLKDGKLNSDEMMRVYDLGRPLMEMLSGALGEEVWGRPLSAVQAIALRRQLSENPNCDILEAIEPPASRPSTQAEPPSPALTDKEIEVALARVKQLKLEYSDTGVADHDSTNHGHSGDQGSEPG